jgi:hypothetical protein
MLERGGALLLDKPPEWPSFAFFFLSMYIPPKWIVFCLHLYVILDNIDICLNHLIL